MDDVDHQGPSRRTVLSGAAIASFAAALGFPIPFGRFLPDGLLPVALAADDEGAAHGKPGLTLLGDRPLNLETPPHLLDDEATPAARMFVRNNGHAPEPSELDPAAWRLKIDGEVENPLELSIAELKGQFETVTLRLQMECGGNGRKFFHPAASGNKWTFGAIACPDWTGVRLADVLKVARPTANAVYTGHYGLDRHLSGDPGKEPISRGVPIAKAMEPHTLIAWAMNGAPMPFLNGAPLRLVVPGWPGSCSQKWLTRIRVRDRVHDGEHMLGQSYRVPAYPVAPGAHVADEDMRIIESMPVRSIVTFPETGARTKPGETFEARGHAWAGDRAVSRVDVSIDFGATWAPATLNPPKNRYAWQRWRAVVTLPKAGYYEIWARATDDAGVAQPPVPPGWNPKGYLNNMQHRIAMFAL
jgi:DMSO/TMAO reductase YedYZ molybdopterin-dependent catalytic subunit